MNSIEYFMCQNIAITYVCEFEFETNYCIYVTEFAKRGLIHASNFSTL